jgi:hypothetical protein
MRVKSGNHREDFVKKGPAFRYYHKNLGPCRGLCRIISRIRRKECLENLDGGGR